MPSRPKPAFRFTIVPVSALRAGTWSISRPGLVRLRRPDLLQILEQLPNTRRRPEKSPLALPVLVGREATRQQRDQPGPRRVGGAALPARHRFAPGPGAGVPERPKAVVAAVLDRAPTRCRGAACAAQASCSTAGRCPCAATGSGAAPVDGPAADDDFDTPAPSAPYPGRKGSPPPSPGWTTSPLVAGRVYWALHGHRWVKAKGQARGAQARGQHPGRDDASQLDPTQSAIVVAVPGSAAGAAVRRFARARRADPGRQWPATRPRARCWSIDRLLALIKRDEAREDLKSRVWSSANLPVAIKCRVSPSIPSACAPIGSLPHDHTLLPKPASPANTPTVDVCPVDCFREGPNFPDHRSGRVHRLRGLHPRVPGRRHLRRGRRAEGPAAHDQDQRRAGLLPTGKSITKRKAPLPDHDEWKDKTGKLDLLQR